MDFKTLTTILFQRKSDWSYVTDKNKEDLFFIFNRYMSKKWPRQAQQFNVKDIDKASCMDIWFQFLRKELKIPYWFWRGPTKKADPPIKGWQVLRDWYKIRLEDIYLICTFWPKECKAEIERIEQIKKEQELV